MIEQLLAFLTTHLSIVALLMPWKQLVITDKTDTTVPAENLNYHLWDLVEKDKWFYKMSTDVVPVPVEDPSLCTISMVFLVFCIMSLLLTITGYGMRTFFPTTDPNIASIVDFSSWGVAMCLFLTMVSTQGDFDT